MAGSVGWSDSGTFSNAGGVTSTVLAVPPGTYGSRPWMVIAAAGKGGSAGLANHTVIVTSTGGVPYTFTFDGSSSGASGDEWGKVDAHALEANGVFADDGIDISVQTTGTGTSPEIGLLGAMVISMLDGLQTVNLQSLASGTLRNNAVFNTGILTWGWHPEVNDHPRFGVGALAEFVRSPDPPSLPSWASRANWTDVLSVKTSDGRGLGQAVVTLGFYTLPSDTPSLVPNPILLAITNAVTSTSNGAGGFMDILCGYFAADALRSRHFAQIFGD